MEKQKNTWKKIVTLIFLIFICIFSVFGIFMVFLDTEMPLTVVSSESMVPTYNRGDLLIIKSVDEGEILPLDVIVFWPITWELYRAPIPMVPIVHRVINVSRNHNHSLYKGSWYKTKGDLFPFIDPFIDPEIPHFCVIGKVVGRIPYLGLPKLWIDTIGGNTIIYIVIIILIILLIYSFIPKQERKIKNLTSQNSLE